MKNCDANEFIDHTTMEECAALYQNTKYFFYGLIFNKTTNKYSYDIAIMDGDIFRNYVFIGEYQSKEECIEKALNSPVFNGKSFWEIEQDMEWIDW